MKVTAILQPRVLHRAPMRSILSSLCAVVILLALAQHARAAAPALPVISNQTFAVTNAIYGAVGDGVTDNTIAIQNAINDASAHGGGTVLIPANGTLSTYLSNPLNLASGINLQIDGGAMLKALPMAEFTSTDHFIFATGVSDVEISGSGTIDGNGADWWAAFADDDTISRPYMVYFNGNCHRVLIQDVTLQNPPKMHLVFKGADDNITIQRILINTTTEVPFPAKNTDGIDLVGRHCLVQNCTINSGDDNIALGSSSSSAVCDDILITNCTFGVGHGVSIGSNTQGGVSNLTVVACTFDGTDYGIRMKSDNRTSGGSGQGGVAQNLTYANITMTNIVHGPIVIYSYYKSFGTPDDVDAATAAGQPASGSLFPIWRNVTISNVTASVAEGGIAGLIWGKKEVPVTNVVLSHVTITAPSSFNVYNARGIQFVDSQVIAPGTNSFNLYNAEVTVTNTVANTNLVTLGGLATPPTNNVLAFFNTQAVITHTNMDGAGSITLGGSTLTFSQGSVSFSNNVSVVSASTLAFTGGTNTFSGALSGSGALAFGLPSGGVLTLLGDSSGYSGNLTVSNGTLLVNNSAGNGTGSGTLTVLSGATLGGTGTIGGPLTLNGILAPGNSAGALTVSSNLVLSSTSVLQYELGTTSDRTVVNGDLTLDGTLNISDAGGFATNTYTLFTYTGMLTDNGLLVGTTPNGSLGYTIDTGTAGLVKLVVAVPPVAVFSGSPTNGLAPFAVTFTDVSTGPITNRFWDFGDSTTSNATETVLQHTYSSAGSNLVQLIVSGPGGASTSTVLILVAPPCNFPLSTNSASFGATGGANSVTVSPYTNVCAWTATSNDAWIQITGGDVTATGTAVVAYTVLPNATSTTSRTGTLTVAGQTFTIIESGDPVPPTVSLIAPTSGVVSNTITLSATAADNVGVTRVDFYRDTGILIASRLSSPFSTNFNTAVVSDGSHCFYAKAFDAANNSASSSTNCVTVDNNAPFVSLTAPTPGVVSNKIALSATAADEAGVTRVDFYRDSSILVASVASPPYTNSFNTATVSDGSHCFYAKAFDAAGNSASSSTNCVTVDNNAPSVSLIAPTSGIVSNAITLSATAADNVGVTRVDFYRDSGVLIVSLTSAPYSTNFNTATASDGSHCFYAKAFDAANNSASSSTNCVTVDNDAPSVPAGLTANSISASQINLNWSASVDPGTGVAGYKVFRDSAQIATTAETSYPDSGLSGGSEHCYSVAAFDNLGRVSASATACAQTFTNLQSMLGSYNGLIIQTNAPTHTSSGSITLNLSNTGSFSAKLILGGVRSTFQGQLDAFGNSTNALVRKGHNSVQVTLHVDLSGSDQITGTVSDGSFTSALLAEREVYSSTNPCPFAGNYTLLLGPPTTDDSTIPKGFGSGTLNIAMTGRGRLRGLLADGTKINALAPMSKHGRWPLFNLLYKNSGALIGWATFTNNTTHGATADWFRPALPSASLYPDGFSTNVTLIGRRYVPPAAGSPSVAGNYQLTLGGGNLTGELVKDVYLYDVGNVVVMSANPENLKAKIDPVTGQLTGSFTHPSLNKNVKFTGLLLQFGNNGAGYFLGATESGFVIFVPSP